MDAEQGIAPPCLSDAFFEKAIPMLRRLTRTFGVARNAPEGPGMKKRSQVYQILYQIEIPNNVILVLLENTRPIYNSFLQNKIWEPWIKSGTVLDWMHRDPARAGQILS